MSHRIDERTWIDWRRADALLWTSDERVIAAQRAIGAEEVAAFGGTHGFRLPADIEDEEDDR